MFNELVEWQPPLLEAVMETRTLELMCANTRVCVCACVCPSYVCVHGHAHQSTDCNPYGGLSVASQISWQPHGAVAVKWVVINKSVTHSNRERGKKIDCDWTFKGPLCLKLELRFSGQRVSRSWHSFRHVCMCISFITVPVITFNGS